MENIDLYVRDSYACADSNYRMNIRVVTELPWSNMFAYNMFLRPSQEELKSFNPEWHIVCLPNFMADPELDGTRQSNFAVLNFTKKMIIIGGTGYTGEIKKGIFSALNFILPHEKNVLSMHCSANVGKDGGLTLDPNFYINFPENMRAHQIRLEGGDCSTDSFCYPSV